MAMPLIRSSGLRLQLKATMTQSTKSPSPMCSYLPKVPLLIAEKPPPKSMIPTLIRLRPIISTTTPLTVGVITRLR